MDDRDSLRLRLRRQACPRPNTRFLLFVPPHLPPFLILFTPRNFRVNVTQTRRNIPYPHLVHPHLFWHETQALGRIVAYTYALDHALPSHRLPSRLGLQATVHSALQCGVMFL